MATQSDKARVDALQLEVWELEKECQRLHESFRARTKELDVMQAALWEECARVYGVNFPQSRTRPRLDNTHGQPP